MKARMIVFSIVATILFFPQFSCGKDAIEKDSLGYEEILALASSLKDVESVQKDLEQKGYKTHHYKDTYDNMLVAVKGLSRVPREHDFGIVSSIIIGSYAEIIRYDPDRKSASYIRYYKSLSYKEIKRIVEEVVKDEVEVSAKHGYESTMTSYLGYVDMNGVARGDDVGYDKFLNDYIRWMDLYPMSFSLDLSYRCSDAFLYFGAGVKGEMFCCSMTAEGR